MDEKIKRKNASVYEFVIDFAGNICYHNSACLTSTQRGDCSHDR